MPDRPFVGHLIQIFLCSHVGPDRAGLIRHNFAWICPYQKIMENPEIAFWRAVIARAWADALHDNASRDRDEARQWLTSFSFDFRLVCQLADIDPESLMEHARKTEQYDWPSARKAA